MKILLPPIVFLLIAQNLFSFDYEYRLNLQNKTDQYLLNQTKLNPGHIWDKDEPLENNLDINTDLKVNLREDLTFTIFDTPQFQSKSQERSNISNQLKETFVTYSPTTVLFFDGGRKVVKKGVGFFKNPVDFIQYPNAQDIDYSKSKTDQNRMLKGVYMGKGEVYLNNMSFSFLYSPSWKEVNQNNNQYYVNAAIKMDQLDIEWIGYSGDQLKTGLNFSMGLGDIFELHLEAAVQERSYKEHIDLYGPYLYTTQNKIKYPLNLLLGTQVAFNSTYKLYVEYYYHESGYSKKQWDSLIEQINQNQNYNSPIQAYNLGVLNQAYFAQGGFSEMQKHYGFIRFESYKIMGDFSFVFSSIFEIQNLGGLFILNPSYSFTENMIVNFSYSFPLGTKNSESKLLYYQQLSLQLDLFF